VLPATPTLPNTFYTLELLQLLHCLLLHAHPSFHGVKGSLALLHVRLGLEARFSFERVWRPIIGSWRHLCALMQRIKSSAAGMPLLLGGPHCVACSRCIQGICMDCCLGGGDFGG
jgi:hypothetical protein